jgi:hypothetical protein
VDEPSKAEFIVVLAMAFSKLDLCT